VGLKNPRKKWGFFHPGPQKYLKLATTPMLKIEEKTPNSTRPNPLWM